MGQVLVLELMSPEIVKSCENAIQSRQRLKNSFFQYLTYIILRDLCSKIGMTDSQQYQNLYHSKKGEDKVIFHLKKCWFSCSGKGLKCTLVNRACSSINPGSLDITSAVLLSKYFLIRINDGDEVVRYYPHRDEELPQDTPSPVLMVSRVKPLYGEPWFNKDYARQLG